MTPTELLKAIVDALPSRIYDSRVYVNMYPEGEEDPINFEIISVSDEGSNDGLFITIKKVE